MNFNCIIKTGLVAVAAMVSLSSFSQDLIARQAPIDKKLKTVDSLALQKQIRAEQSEYPALSLYPNWNNPVSYTHLEGLRKLLLDFAAKGKPIAAICAAPMVLGKLGLLKGRKATCYPSFEQYLEGAECVSEPVVRDGNIITGMGPGAAMEFALAIVDLLVGKEKVDELVEAMCVKR